MTFPVTYQTNEKNCGAACLCSIAAFYGLKFDLAYLQQLSHTGTEGTSLLSISKAAKTLGFLTLIVKISFNTLRNEGKLPAIVHWKKAHFVVVFKITRTKVFVSDPFFGILSFSTQEFIDSWIYPKANQNVEQGIVMLLEPMAEFRHFSSINK